MFISYLYVALGGALGTIARFWLSGVIANKCGQTFPWGTLVINVTGSFVITLFAALAAPDSRFLVGPNFRTFFMVGVCGGYTTFSSFSLQTLSLAQDGEWLLAGANCLLSVFLCLLGAWLGQTTAMIFNPK
jgi:CrcB protein